MGSRAERRIWVVSGPSCVGKTTLINSRRLGEITGLDGDFAVHVASAGPMPAGSDLVVHYNIQRPLHQHLVDGGSVVASDLAAAATSFSEERGFAELCDEANLGVVVLAAEAERLLHRVRRRSSIESPDEAYPVADWVERYRAVEVVDIYRAWLDELERRGISTLLVDARDPEFRLLDSRRDLLALVEGRASDWSGTKIRDWSDPDRYQYQRVPLPGDPATPGSDRSATAELVFKEPVAGRSVLDVGCAEGFFSFEAEMRDARRVKGLEPMPSRFEAAGMIREIRGSRIELEQRDVTAHPIDEEWDVILLLNVLHHLSSPLDVLRNLAECARERLILEFPSFADPRYRRHRNLDDAELFDRHPVIGVSSIEKGVAQTFVYSPEAIRAMLLEQGLPIRTVEFDRSPIEGRFIAHAHK